MGHRNVFRYGGLQRRLGRRRAYGRQSWKTIAHELGHKLINAGHEYRDIGPQHEVYADGGLLLYGDGTDIPSGREGRFHRERLHRSPFVYRQDRDGNKVWNPDYQDGGGYYDRIYQDLTIGSR